NSVSINIGTLAANDNAAGGDDSAVITLNVTSNLECGPIANTAHISASNEPVADQGNDDSNTAIANTFPGVPGGGTVIGLPFDATDGNPIENNAGTKTDWASFIGTNNLIVPNDNATGSGDRSETT